MPIGAVGAEDGFEVLLDSDELQALPAGLGDRVKQSASRITQVRPNESFTPPVAVPRLPPPRYYFCFGRPFDTSSVDSADEEARRKLYAEVRSELEGCISWLLEKREKDPYAAFLPRFMYESATNWTRQAPTFSI